MKIKVLGVDFNYGSIQALKSVSFEVGEGDFLGIIGPNGSGKTTLLRCITKVLNPRVGTILLDEKDVSCISREEIAKMVGVVPQNSMLTFPFTVLDVVLMGRIPYLSRLARETKRDLKIAKTAMELTNIEHLADRDINELSGGEKQRVIIAKALAQEPEVILLDEPTLHLDINHQFEILELIKKLNGRKELTVIAVFHDLNLAARFCNKLLLLNSGKIHSVGSVEDVLTRENIEEVYHVNVKIARYSTTNSLNVVVISRSGDSSEVMN